MGFYNVFTNRQGKYLNEENENSLVSDALLAFARLLGCHRLVAESKQVKWFPHQPLVIRQQWLTFISNNVFLKLTKNAYLKNLLVLEADKLLSWNYPKKGKGEKKNLRKTGCTNLEDRPDFFFFLVSQKVKLQSFDMKWRWRPRMLIMLGTRCSHLSIVINNSFPNLIVSAS